MMEGIKMGVIELMIINNLFLGEDVKSGKWVKHKVEQYALKGKNNTWNVLLLCFWLFNDVHDYPNE